MRLLTFMIGMGSSPGAPRSSIMFLMSMLRSAILRSGGKESALVRGKSEGGSGKARAYR